MTNPPLPHGMQEAAGLAQWNDMVGQAFGDIAVDARAPLFRASLRRRSWGALALSEIQSMPARVDGGALPPPQDGARGCFLLLNVRGQTTVMQDGRTARLGPGELSVVRQGQPYRIAFDRAHRMQVLAVPELDPRSDIDEHVARSHPGREAPLLGAFMARLADLDAAPQPSTLAGDAGVRLAQDLLALSWPRRDAAPGPRALAAWEGALEACVERELCDPELDAAVLGRRLGISARYVQMVFAGAGTTATAYIQERRLRRVALRLRRDNAARIGEVALEAGFNDLSHFCRCFRRRYGCSARDWRLRA